jgi:hypothetical protein
MMMGIRNKKAVLEIAVEQFKEFKIPMSVTHKEYLGIVGNRIGLSAPSIKRSFKRWPILMKAVSAKLATEKKPEPPKPEPRKAEAKPAPAAKPKTAPKPKAAPVKKES